MTKIHYDHGWNAFIDNEPFDASAAKDWRDGWLDCRSAKPEQRIKI